VYIEEATDNIIARNALAGTLEGDVIANRNALLRHLELDEAVSINDPGWQQALELASPDKISRDTGVSHMQLRRLAAEAKQYISETVTHE
jgi:hypothetical protein